MKKIKIIYTGGTIGGKFGNYDNIIDKDFKPSNFKSLLKNKFPDLQSKVEFSIDTPINKFSENIIPADWCKIATSVYDACKEADNPIIIAHGTDTMTYTSAALSFMLRGLKIPVILTGSNYPLERQDTDAIRNMSDSIKVALDDRFKGVFIVFSGSPHNPSQVHLGCRARKKASSSYNHFETVNGKQIGELKKGFFDVESSIKILNPKLLSVVTNLHETKKLELKNEINDKIAFFKIYPGFNPELIDNVVERKLVKGIILELYESGTGCIEEGKYSLIGCIEKATSRNYGIPFFATSQHQGKVSMDTYVSSKKLLDAGVTPLEDMITEAAIPKLMWVLGHYESRQDVVKKMRENISGEIGDENEA